MPFRRGSEPEMAQSKPVILISKHFMEPEQKERDRDRKTWRERQRGRETQR